MSGFQRNTLKIHNNYLKINSLRNVICNYYARKKSSLRLWEEDITSEIKINIEKYWYKDVVKRSTNYCDVNPYYVLPMFPYPSGNLHMGHVRVYSISDTIARFQQLNGSNSIHPIGWDAFGLPAENAALERNIPPHAWTKRNISSMKEQLKQLGFNFDWDREISTCDPDYYKWTQYIFLKLFEKKLAYQSEAHVNWDPVDKTVLADEQVDDLGCSWRSGAKVEKRYLTQWFIKTTKFAKELYDGLGSDCLENWNDIINLQKHWIGDCDGVVVTFKMKVNNEIKAFDVWTSEPYKFIHGNFLTISTSHPFIQNLNGDNNISLTCYNPITNSDLPVYITDNVNYPIGKDVLIACSDIDEGDKKIASLLGLPISNQKYNISIESSNCRAVDIALSKNAGGHFVSSKLKDWLISRQRFWGTPIPIIHCKYCGAVPVPYDELPVQLPVNQLQINDSTTTCIQTLDKFDEWVNCKCPTCHSDAKRESDTMDTFVDSSWYYYRFLDPTNKEKPFSKERILNHMPVDIYIGGKEHAVLHLYYARFMSYFLHSLGWTPCKEPFKKLVVQGMVMGQSYKLKDSGKYIPSEQVEKIGKEYKEKSTGDPVLTQWEKMSKSKYNGENPERLLSTYGCDTTRLLILADVPPATPRRWSDATLPGVLNWQHRLWITMRDFLKHRNNVPYKNTLTQAEFTKYEDKIWDSRNYFNATATYHFRYTQKLSVGISRLQSLTNVLRNKIPPEVIAKSMEYEKALAMLIIMLSPVTPHFCSELWAGFLSAPHRVCEETNLIDWKKSVLEQKWPRVEENYELSFLCKFQIDVKSFYSKMSRKGDVKKLVTGHFSNMSARAERYEVAKLNFGKSTSKSVKLPIVNQVDGADRCDLKIKASDLRNLSHEKALQMMLNEEPVKKRLTTEIHKTKFELFPECRAILHIFPKRKVKQVKVDQTVA